MLVYVMINQCQADRPAMGHGENFEIMISSDNVKLHDGRTLRALPIHYFISLSLSVTLTTFQGHNSRHL